MNIEDYEAEKSLKDIIDTLMKKREHMLALKVIKLGHYYKMKKSSKDTE